MVVRARRVTDWLLHRTSERAQLATHNGSAAGGSVLCGERHVKHTHIEHLHVATFLCAASVKPGGVGGDTYYLVGEGKKTLGADCSACFANLYSTKDLANWKLESCVLRNQDIVAPPPWNKESFYRMERPKIFKCPKTGKWMMWFL
jgi:hypothetical protein